ncbi:MAG: hypothetical protein WAW96_20425 [Alphaproteobacteria bacterium]
MNELTLYGGPSEQNSKQRPVLVNIGQWVMIVSRLHKAISVELMALEKSQEKMILEKNFALDPQQARHLVAITRAVERVRIINKGVTGEAETKRDKQRLRDTENAIEDLSQKIDRFITGEKA